MESSISQTSSSSSSSSPSIGLGSNESNDLISLANEELCNGDVVQVITQLTNTIESKVFLYETNNNNNNNNINNNININTKTNDQMINRAKELSNLYAIRSQSYLKLGFHQLAFDDSILGIQFDANNSNSYYLKGRALLGLKQKDRAEQAFKMALELRKTFAEASEELIKMRFEALKEAGFDEETANKFAPQSRSVNEAIDHILSTSLTSDQLSTLRASYVKNLTNTDNHFSNSANNTCFSTISGDFGNKNLNNITQNRADGQDLGSESLGLKLISDIDNCLGSILDSDEEKSKFFDEKMDNNMISATNSKNYLNNNTNTFTNNNFCDSIGDNNLLPRSLSPQIPPQNVFGISTDLKIKPILQKANIFSNFSIDLNKESLGSHIIPKTNSNISVGANITSNSSSIGGEPPRKTFADIASANTKKPIQSIKFNQTITVKSIQKSDFKPQIFLESSNKLSSLESFCGSNSTADGLDKIEKIGSLVLSAEPTRPTNIMAYKGLWVCNISPNTPYQTLRNVFSKYGNIIAIQTFERKATNGSNIVFVHYDNSRSPTEAIADLFGVYRKDINFDENTHLKLRFTPSMDQTKTADLPSMEKARRIVEKTGECFNWRLSTGCHKGERCLFKHISINKSVDSQPWVKALKKKANET